MSLAKKGRLYLEKFPDATAVDLVENCGFGLSYARFFISDQKRKKYNEEYLKDRPKRTPRPPTVDWEQNYRGAMMHVTSLEKQIIGYKAVINYLEHQLTAMAEKHGSSV
jgi:hypothetical protein